MCTFVLVTFRSVIHCCCSSQQSTGNVAVAYILFTVALHTASVFALQSAILLLVKEGEERLPLLSAFTSNFGINFAVIDGNGLPPDLWYSCTHSSVESIKGLY
jgi:hypothetical protein